MLARSNLTLKHFEHAGVSLGEEGGQLFQHGFNVSVV